jgi:amino acid permease
MTRRKQGLLIVILGVAALTLSAPWWFLNSLASAGLAARLGLQMSIVCVFVGLVWMFRGEPKARKGGRSRRRNRGLTVVPRVK